MASLMDDDLSWTVIPSDIYTMRSFGRFVTEIEADMRAADPMLGDIRVAMVATADSIDQSIATFLISEGDEIFNYNGQTFQENLDQMSGDCPDGCFRFISDDNFDFVSEQQLLEAYNPHITLLISGDGAFAHMAMPLVEINDTQDPRSSYILSIPDPAMLLYLQDQLAQSPPIDMNGRLHAINFPKDSPDLFDDFELYMQGGCADFVPPLASFFPPFSEHVYDAVYLVALAHLAAGNYNITNDLMTGRQLSLGLAALSPAGHMDPNNATQIDLGPERLQNAVNILLSDGEIDVRGVSGDCDFDLTTGSPRGGIELYCIADGMMPPRNLELGLQRHVLRQHYGRGGRHQAMPATVMFQP